MKPGFLSRLDAQVPYTFLKEHVNYTYKRVLHVFGVKWLMHSHRPTQYSSITLYQVSHAPPPQLHLSPNPPTCFSVYKEYELSESTMFWLDKSDVIPRCFVIEGASSEWILGF